MPTYETGAVVQNRAFKPFPDGTVGVRQQSYTFTVAPALDDVVKMIPVYEGETVLSVTLISTDLDTNGAPLITLAVGDGAVNGRYISGSQIGRTGGFAITGAGVSGVPTFPYTYTADDTIDVYVTAGPATGVVGTLRLVVEVA